MRVIGGRSRGRRLSAPVAPGVRPTSDRVREAIFDILGSMGGVGGLAVADLFCGSGAMGAEALSRGAASVTFVDRERAALDAVRANLRAVGLGEDPATVVRGVLPEWLGGAPRFDLALCDPPYAFDRWDDLLGAVRADIVVLESSGPVAVPPGWEVARTRRYGGTLVTVARSTPAPSPSVPVTGS
ncbi:MAG TPA: RsmD family RNA methyltransferase [Acidimicrobiales bacterium]|nr:RsmD family RNA methyltransferase [Acidimicrobiales bacterium]